MFYIVGTMKTLPLVSILFASFVSTTSGYGTFSVSHSVDIPKPFSVDRIIGSTLYNQGNVLSQSGNGYEITLLSVEGNLRSYLQDVGYVVAFRWYYSEHVINSVSMKIQMYYLDSGDSGGSSYILAYETEWLLSNPGYNEHHIGQYSSGWRSVNDQEYILAIMTENSNVIPVLADYCNGDGKVILQGSESSQPIIGSSVNFTRDIGDSLTECVSFSLQAIYAISSLAFDPNCAIYVVTEANEILLTQENFVDRTGSSQCLIVRPQTDILNLQVEVLRDALVLNGCNDFFILYSFSSANDVVMTELGEISCTSSDHSILYLSAGHYFRLLYSRSGSSVTTVQFTLKVSIQGEEEGGLSGGAIAGIVAGIIIMMVIVIICVTKKKQQPQQNPQVTPQPRPSSSVNISEAATASGTSSKPNHKPDQGKINYVPHQRSTVVNIQPPIPHSTADPAYPPPASRQPQIPNAPTVPDSSNVHPSPYNPDYGVAPPTYEEAVRDRGSNQPEVVFPPPPPALYEDPSPSNRH